jgi:hypothetical protein
MREHIRGDLVGGALMVLAIWSVVYGWNVVKTVYQDHQQLVAQVVQAKKASVVTPVEEFRGVPPNFVSDLASFANKPAYRSRTLIVYCVPEETACEIAKKYYNALRLISGWPVKWGDLLPAPPWPSTCLCT